VSFSTALDSLPRPPDGWLIFSAAFLPGMLAGIQMAGLLFFLNPDLPFATAPLTNAILVFGLLWGAVTAAALMPFTWGHVNRAGRILPWSIVVALAVCAVVDWLHASHLSYYMQPGINTRLIKAAIGLSATALIGFYTALLHSIARRPYGIRSRLLMGALVVTSVYIMVERREAFEPLAVATPRPSRVEQAPRPTLWTIGIGGATLDVLLPLTQEGRLPFFASLLEQGAYARLSSYSPRRDRALWTSLSTAKLPYRHGVLDDRRRRVEFLDPGATLRLSPVGVDFTHWGMLGAPSRLVDSNSAGVLPVWEVLDRLGVRSGLIGWPLTDPVPDSAEFAFSDRFFDGQFGRSSGRPKELTERGTLFRTEPEPAELGKEELSAVEQAALSQDLWRESLAGFLLDQEPEVQAYFLYLPGLEIISRAYYSAFYEVQFEGQQSPEAQREAAYLISYYEHLDGFLADLLARVREPRVVAVVSAFGFEAQGAWGRLWGRMLEQSAWRGTADNSPDGVLLLAGRGIQPGAFVSPAELTDVLPTLLYALGLPIARDLDGGVLTGAFASGFLATQPLTFVPSYETLAEIEIEEAPDIEATEPPS
jgi:predicted AlkP superfamily phosphohydrolase/phosphomutase